MQKTESPVIIQWDRKKNLLKVEDRESGTVLARCYIGDDLMVESIADSLSAKRLPKDADKVRQILMDARRAVSMRVS